MPSGVIQLVDDEYVHKRDLLICIYCAVSAAGTGEGIT